MTRHIYRLIMTISMTDDEKRQSGAQVAGAVSTLLEDNAGEWLLEAIGHPDPVDVNIEVETFGD